MVLLSMVSCPLQCCQGASTLATVMGFVMGASSRISVYGRCSKSDISTHWRKPCNSIGLGVLGLWDPQESESSSPKTRLRMGWAFVKTRIELWDFQHRIPRFENSIENELCNREITIDL